MSQVHSFISVGMGKGSITQAFYVCVWEKQHTCILKNNQDGGNVQYSS
jgi:hypothetical protein